jgi:lon-related putative ATP-dependent protease
MISTLKKSDLRWSIDESKLNVAHLNANKNEASARPGGLGQSRALSALDLGLGIQERGYNIFVVGAAGTGRTSTVRSVVKERAQSKSTPSDIILIYNFEDRDRPHAVQVDAGDGPTIKARYDALVEEMVAALEKTFESDSFANEQQELERIHQEKTDALLEDIQEKAKASGFLLTKSRGTLSLGVADKEGAALSEEAYDELPTEEKEALEEKAESLQSGLEDMLRKIRILEKAHDETIANLLRATASTCVDPIFVASQESLQQYDFLVAHLGQAKEDVLTRLSRIAPDHHVEDSGDDDSTPTSSAQWHHMFNDEDDADHDEPSLLRYRVNVLVTHKKDSGAPVVQETHPTTGNLLGRIIHRTRMGGDTASDFTRIKAGALYRANGGYLIIQAQDLLRDPTAWEGLKRALKNREIELDDPGEPGRMVTIASLRPEPVALALKILLIGTPDLYYTLARADPDFGKLFKVKVDFDVEMKKDQDGIDRYLKFIVGITDDEKLLDVSTTGAGRILEHAARVSHNQEKLTTRFGWIADLLREANFFAGSSDANTIDRVHINKALAARKEREGFIEFRMRDDITNGKVRIDTAGAVVGQTNGLTVVDLGSYQFGMPVRVTSRVGAGKGEIIDIERETDLGGPIHTKGTMILRGILLDRFGQEVPLRLTGTICLEQSYSDIDGDSASLAEACALLSALAKAPISQRFAMTGSIDQRGQVQSIGGVNEKIEGFFQVTQSTRKPAECPSVIIPASNQKDLMLDEELVKAVDDGRFAVYAAEKLEDVLELLTGLPWDQGKDALRPRIIETLRSFIDVQDSTKRSTLPKKRRAKALPRAAKAKNPDDDSNNSG